MKGIMSSIIVLFAFLSTLLVVMVFSSSIQESRDLVNLNAVGDRVFYKFAAIEYSITRIIEKDLNGTFSVELKEGAFNLVTLNLTIPSSPGNFTLDLANYERFAESRLNQTNLVVDLNLSTVSSCLPVSILPYNISYGTLDGSLTNCGFGTGQRDLKIIPNGDSPSYLNGYDMSISTGNASIDPSSASWTPPGACTGGTLNWSVRVTGAGSGVYGPVWNMIDSDGKCVFRISENVTGNKIVQINNQPGNQDPEETMVVTVQPGFNIAFAVTLNLTDIPGKLRVGLAPQSLKVRETLFKTERNDTVTLQ